MPASAWYWKQQFGFWVCTIPNGQVNRQHPEVKAGIVMPVVGAVQSTACVPMTTERSCIDGRHMVQHNEVYVL